MRVHYIQLGMFVHYIQLGMFVSHGLRLRRYIGSSLGYRYI